MRTLADEDYGAIVTCAIATVTVHCKENSLTSLFLL
jgi:hypothetical protein